MTPARFSDAHASSREHAWLQRRFVRTACWIVALACLLYLVVAHGLAGNAPVYPVATSVLLIASGLGLLLLRANRLQRAAQVLVYGALFGALLAGIHQGSLQLTTIYGQIIVIAMAGWLLGLRHATILAVLAILGTLGIAVALEAGHLQPRPFSRPLVVWLGLAIILSVAALLTWLVTRAFQERLTRVELLGTLLHERLRESQANETQLRAITDNMPAMVVHNRKRHCIYANRQYAQFVGRTQSGLIGLHIRDQIGAAAYAQIESFIERAEGGETVDYRRAVRMPDGHEVVIATTLVPERNEQGEVIGEFALIQDVTQAAQQESALRRSEDKFSRVFASSPAPMAIVRLADGQHVDVNAAWSRLHGWRHEEAIGRTSLDLGIWPDAEARENWFQPLTRGQRVHHQERSLRMRNGEARHILMSTEFIEIDQALCALIIEIDITEIRSAEKTLRQSEDKFSKIFHGSPVSIAITRLEGGILLDVNRAWEALHGWTREEILGASSVALGIFQDPTEREAWRQRLEADGRIHNLDVRYRTKAGETREALLSSEGIELAGQLCILHLEVDITERKQAEEALRQSELRFATMFRSSPQPISITHEESGRFIDVNDAFLEISGYAREEVLGHTLEELEFWTDPQDRQRWRAAKRYATSRWSCAPAARSSGCS